MIVATAGHVDHGKTSLVRALTGVDTDRLPEEKKRGLTIDLGFAYLPVDDAQTIGFVDVPGHERFVHNMLSGVAGIDFALLVVAADDGPMPQTREHLAILDLLGVSQGAVALTKIDRVSDARVAEVKALLAALLAPTALRAAPVFPLSSLGGHGVAALKAHLQAAAQALRPRTDEGNFRLAVDRTFSIAGAGLGVTGPVVSGAIRVGDAVRALLAGQSARVRAIHAQNAAAQRGVAGQRCALNLAGLGDKTAIERGDWIVAGDVPAAVRKFDARLRVLADEAKPLAHWTPVHVHLGAANVIGRVALLEGDSIAPGAAGLVQLVLDRPLGALFGDGFILRDQSARRTLAGGRVIDVFPPARGRARPERLAALAAQVLDDPAAALGALLAQAAEGVDLTRFAMNRNLTPAAAVALAERLPVQRAGDWGFSPAHWDALRAKALEALTAWHRRAPDSAGPPESRLLEGSGLRLPRAALTTLIESLVSEGRVVRDGAGLRLAEHRIQLSAADAALWQKVEPLLASSALRAPSVVELAATLATDPRRLEAALSRLERQGLLVRVSKTRFFLPAALRRLEQLAEEEAHASGAITAAAFRDRSGIGRNLTIEVLEFFDRIKFTRRKGDAHVLQRDQHGRESHPGGAPGLQIQ